MSLHPVLAERLNAALQPTMERTFGYLERGGTGRGTYWTLRTELHGRLAAAGRPERDRRARLGSSEDTRAQRAHATGEPR